MTTVAETLQAIYDCPADIMCGPCRRRIGLLADVAEKADAFNYVWDSTGDYHAAIRVLKVSLAALTNQPEGHDEGDPDA